MASSGKVIGKFFQETISNLAMADKFGSLVRNVHGNHYPEQEVQILMHATCATLLLLLRL